MVKCERFRMWNRSISMFFGKSPKIEFICGKCGQYGEGRISMGAMHFGNPVLRCDICGEPNYFPIELTHHYDDE